MRMYRVNSDLQPLERSGFAYEFATTENPQQLYVWVNARHTKGASMLIQLLKQQTSIELGGTSYSIHGVFFLRRYRRGYVQVVIT